jgi:hypothetical protein
MGEAKSKGYVDSENSLKLNQKGTCMSRNCVLPCWQLLFYRVKRILVSKCLISDLNYDEPCKGSKFEYSPNEYRRFLDSG